MTRRVRFTPFLFAGVFLTGATSAHAADVPFAARPAISTGADGARQVKAADVDGDGDLDVLSASSVDGRIAWYENTARDGSAWTARTIGVAAGTWSLDVADVDHDGDLDVFSTGPAGGALLWYENTAGNGTAWTAHTIASGLSSPRAVVAADVDRDGHADVAVISGTSVDGSLTWYENLTGNGSAWTPHTVSSAPVGGWAIAAGDVDGDGDRDLLSASRYDDTVAWYENVGGAGATFVRHVVGTGAGGASAVQVADVDRDGDLDVLAASTFDSRLLWYSNEGGNGTSWSVHTISTAVAAPLALHAADVDGDGDVDALSASQPDDTIVWAENLGAGASFTLHTVAAGPDNALSVAAADLDHDGDADVLSASFLDDRVAWFRNETVHRNACFGPPMHIATTPGAPVTTLAADVDGDGAVDVVWGAGTTVSQLAWERNATGTGSTWSSNPVATMNGLADVKAGDIDRDGDLDLVAFSGTTTNPPSVNWYAQPSSGAWPAQSIVPPSGYRLGSLSVADIDGDGDLDVVAGRPYASNFGWQANAGNGTGWATHPLAFMPTWAVTLADIDGDGDLDAYTEWYDAEVNYYTGWRSNLDGAGSFGASHDVSECFLHTSGYTPQYSADVDGDGDPDLFTLGFLLLDQSAGQTFQCVALAGVWGASLAFADFDRDGDVDLVKTGSGAADWAENLLGSATSWSAHPLPASSVSTAFAGDFDGDGDADVGLGTSTGLEWRRNDGGQASFSAASVVPPSPSNGQLVPLLRLEVTHLGRMGDSDLELASLGLRFEENGGDALTTAEANALIASLRVYRDADGNGVFDPGLDTLVTTLDTLALSAGVQTLPLADGDPKVQVSVGVPRTFFVVAELPPDASLQVPNQFRVAHLATGPAASRIEDRSYDLALGLACPSDVASAIVGPITPVELERFTIE